MPVYFANGVRKWMPELPLITGACHLTGLWVSSGRRCHPDSDWTPSGCRLASRAAYFVTFLFGFFCALSCRSKDVKVYALFLKLIIALSSLFKSF